MLKRIIPFVMALAMIFTMGAAFASSSASAAIVPVSMTVAGEGTITVTLVNENQAAEDGSGDVIIRLYECKHAAVQAELTLNIPAAGVYECDLLENEGKALDAADGKVKLSLRGFEVKTLRVKRA